MQEVASRLAVKVLSRVQWLKLQSAQKSIGDLDEAKRIATEIMRDGSNPAMVRLAAIDRLSKLEGWDKPQRHIVAHRSLDEMSDAELLVLLR